MNLTRTFYGLEVMVGLTYTVLVLLIGDGAWWVPYSTWIGGFVMSMGVIGLRLVTQRERMEEMSDTLLAAHIATEAMVDVVDTHNLHAEVRDKVEDNVTQLHRAIEWARHDPIGFEVLTDDDEFDPP